MGADLILAHLVIDLEKEPDWEAGRKAAQEWTGEPSEYGYLDCFDSPEKVRTVLLEDIEALKVAWTGNRRDCTWLDLCGKRILLTGGMTWGDSPTELFDSFWRLCEAGIHRAMGFE